MAYADFQLTYQVNPIVLVAGAAGTGVMSLTSILNPGGIGGAFAFGSFRVLPGGTLIDNDNAKYPLATMAVAANAIITNPLRFAIEMATPASSSISLKQRLGAFKTLKSVLDNHISMGGYFNVATPAFLYTGCLLLNLSDASDVPDGAQTQTRWVWNFEQPLLTVTQADAVVSEGMAKIAGQTYNAGDPPGSKPLLTSVSTPSIGQQVTPNADSSAAVTQPIPITPGSGSYMV